MALHLGSSEKLKVISKNIAYNLKAVSQSGVRLISSDDYMLTDKNGLYITVKERE